jgi:hypothetical protein
LQAEPSSCSLKLLQLQWWCHSCLAVCNYEASLESILFGNLWCVTAERVIDCCNKRMLMLSSGYLTPLLLLLTPLWASSLVYVSVWV